MDISWRIRGLLKEYNINQAQLASQLGMSQPFISQVANGKRTVSLDTLVAICDAMGISLSEFWEPFGAHAIHLSPEHDRFYHRCRSLTSVEITSLDNIVEIYLGYKKSLLSDQRPPEA